MSLISSGFLRFLLGYPKVPIAEHLASGEVHLIGLALMKDR